MSTRYVPTTHTAINWSRRVRVVLIAVLVGEVIAALWSSPAFRVRTVRVEGLRLTSSEQVKGALREQVSGSWVFFSSSRAAQRIERLPAVEEALVSRHLVGEVRIKVFERQPVALLRAPNASYWLDARGIAFWQTNRAEGLPVISLSESVQVRLGQPVSNRSVQAALEILCRYAPGYLLPVAQIEVDPEGNLCLNMKEGKPQVRLGDGSALEQKLARTALLWNQPQIVQQAEYLDISCVEKPVWKPRVEGRGHR